jgi:hypothetical protein
MIEMQPPAGRVLPFARRWHVIYEIDLVRFVARHEQLARLCDRLETCADALPIRPSRAEAEQLCRILDELTEAAENDDALIADVFRGSESPLNAALLRAIRARRTADHVYGQELIAALRAGPSTGGEPVAETLGYMLRCFFTACRQRLAFEELAILTIGQHRLATNARALLVENLGRRLG